MEGIIVAAGAMLFVIALRILLGGIRALESRERRPPQGDDRKE